MGEVSLSLHLLDSLNAEFLTLRADQLFLQVILLAVLYLLLWTLFTTSGTQSGQKQSIALQMKMWIFADQMYLLHWYWEQRVLWISTFLLMKYNLVHLSLICAYIMSLTQGKTKFIWTWSFMTFNLCSWIQYKNSMNALHIKSRSFCTTLCKNNFLLYYSSV